jgi:hypothetical protein
MTCFVGGCSTFANRVVVDESQKKSVKDVSNQNFAETVKQEEERNGIPDGLLLAVAKVESGCTPYAINTKRASRKFKTKGNAVSFVEKEVKNGNSNISVGYCQLHYRSHRKNFASIDDMLDPQKNIAYAATLLKSFYDRHGSWEQAVKLYHSRKSRHNSVYYEKVMKKRAIEK